jgi:hypothetical protein
VQGQIETALNWGRYGEILNYDSAGDRLLRPHADSFAGSDDFVH